MATLASLTVRLGIDSDSLRSGAQRASQTVRRMGDRMRRDNDGAMRGLVRNANARLRDLRTRFTSEGDRSGRSLGSRIARGMTSAVGAGFRAMRRSSDDSMRGLVRGADGRLRDLRGRFVREGDRSGRSLGSRIVRGIGRGIAGLGHILMNGIGGALSMAGRSIGSNPVIGTIALMLATAIGGALAPLLGAIISGMVVSVTGLGVIGLGAMILKDEPAVKKAAKRLKDTVKSTLKDAAQPLIPAFKTALDKVGGMIKGLKTHFASMFGAMSMNVPILTKGVNHAMSEIVQGIEDMLTGSQDTFRGFSAFIGKIGEGLGAFFRILGKNPADQKVALEDLGSFIKRLIIETALFINFLTSMYTRVRGWVVNVINAFKWLYDVLVGHSIVPDLVNKIIAWFAKLPGRVVGAVSRMVASAIAKFASFYSRAVSWTSRMVSKVVSWIAGLPGKAARAVASLASRLYSKVYSAGSSMLRAARSGVSRVVSAVRSLPGKAASAVSGIGSRLYNAGRSLINGFVRGIKSAFGSVSSTLGKLTSMLPDWKGPETLDRKILTPAGESVMAGFVSGLEAAAPAVRKQLAGVTADLPGMAADVSGVIRAQRAEPQRVILDVAGGEDALKKVIKKWVRVDGRGDVQRAFT